MLHAHSLLMIVIVAIFDVAYVNYLAVTADPRQDESAVSITANAESESTSGTTIDPKFGQPGWFKDRTVSNQDGIFLYVQTDDPCSNPLEAEKALDHDCCAAIADIIDKWYEPGAGAKIGIDRNYVKEHLVFEDRMLIKQYKDQHTEELCMSFGKDYEYYRGYSQLLLTDEFRNEVKDRWKKEQTRSRLFQTGVIGGSFLGLLLIFFGYLRLEQASRGFYSGRLQTVGIIVVLLLAVMTYWLAQSLQLF